MNFWLRNIILGIFLTALAVAFLANQDFLLSFNGAINSVEESLIETTAPATNSPPQEAKSKTSAYKKGSTAKNAAAVGLSKFYANLHGDMDGEGPRVRNNIVYLPEPKGDLKELLQARGMVVRPYKKNWQGDIASRAFRRSETLNQKLTEYAEKEGLALIWWINRDYVIKDPFRVNKDILKTTFQVVKAIEGHFASGLSIFFCNNQRAIVVINSAPQPFLDEECILLVSDNPY